MTETEEVVAALRPFAALWRYARAQKPSDDSVLVRCEDFTGAASVTYGNLRKVADLYQRLGVLQKLSEREKSWDGIMTRDHWDE